MLTKEQSLRRNKNIISSLLLLLVPLGGYLVYKDLNKTPTFYEGGTLTNYERTLKLDKQYSYEEGKIQNVPDTEYLGYFTFLKDGFNEHTISLTSEDKPKSIQKHVHFDTDRDSVTNTFTTDGIVIDTNYKTTETKNKTLGAPTPNIKQTFILRNTTDETKETNFTSTTRLNSNTISYNGRTITITDTPTILRAEEKTASIPEFASDIGYENPETEQFENYTHTYRTPAFLTFETDEGTAVYDWRDAKHLDHTVTLYEHDNNFYLSFTVSDITIEPNSSFEIDPAYGLDEFQNYDVRYDGDNRVSFAYAMVPMRTGDVNGDTYSDLIIATPYSDYGGNDTGSIFVVFGSSSVATGTYPLGLDSSYSMRFDGGPGDQLGYGDLITVEDINGDGFGDLAMAGAAADYSYSNAGSVWVVFSTLIDDYSATSTGNALSLTDTSNFNIRFDGSRVNEKLGGGFLHGSMAAGDVNDDGNGDLIIGAPNSATSGFAYVILSTRLDDVGDSTGNVWGLDDGANYNIRYEGGESGGYLADESNIAIGDVNDDDKEDLVLVDTWGSAGTGGSGSAYILLSTLIDDIGATTGNNFSFDNSSYYSIRIDGHDGNGLGVDSGRTIIHDVNGDSKEDLILNTQYGDYYEASAGAAWVIFSTLLDDTGTTTGNVMSLASSTSYNIRFDGTGYDDYTYEGTIAAGDVNGDGLGDLVIGAYGYWAAYVIFSTLIDDVGTTTGNNWYLGTTSTYNIQFDEYYLTHGRQLAIGDLNDDGFGDLALGSQWSDYNGSNSGSMWVMFSTLIDDAGTSTGNIWSLGDSTGNYNIRYDGTRYLGGGDWAEGNTHIGDADGDGKMDLIISETSLPTSDPETPSVYVVDSTYIDDVGVSTDNNKILTQSTTTSYRYDEMPSIYRLGGYRNGSVLGGDTIVVEDINGDAVKDLILGVTITEISDSDQGSVFVMFGTNARGNRTLSIADNYNVRFDGTIGEELSDGGISAGDVNGDGLGDLVISSPDASNEAFESGSAYIIFSTLLDDVGTTTGNEWLIDSASSYNVRYDGAVASDGLTNAGAHKINDVNGDGLGDLILGAPFADNNGGTSGSAYVLFSSLIDDVGETTGNNKSLGTGTNYNIRFDGGLANDALTTYSGISGGDVNGDGLNDLILASPAADNNGNASGSVYLFFSTLIDDVGTTTGNIKPLNTGTNYNARYDGGAASDGLGRNECLGVGDVNGDENDDLLLCAWQADNNGGTSGSAYIIFSTLIDDVGTTTNNSFALSTGSNYNIRFDGSTASDFLTNNGSFALGDINGDSLGDLVLGAYGADPEGGSSGAAYIMFSTLVDDVGTTTGNNHALSNGSYYNVRLDGTAASDYLTQSNLTNSRAIAIGDVNGDQTSDLLVGAHGAGDGGAVWALYSTLLDDQGTATGSIWKLASTTRYSVRYDGAAAGDTLGNYIVIDDMNGDGLNDAILSASAADNVGGSSGSVYGVYSTPPPKYKTQGTVNFTGSVQFK